MHVLDATTTWSRTTLLADLRRHISQTLASNPDQLLIQVVVETNDRDSRSLHAVRELTSYKGAALKDHEDTPIPSAYEVFVNDKLVEVLMINDKLVKNPIDTLADEVVRTVTELGMWHEDGTAFFVIVPAALRSYMDTHMMPEMRRDMFATLKRRLEAENYTIMDEQLRLVLTVKRNR